MQFHYIILFVVVGNAIYSVLSSPTDISKIEFREPAEHIEIPEQCRNLTYCTLPPKNYPTREFNEMFKFFNGVPIPKLVLTVDFDNRIGDYSDGCESEVKFDPLYNVREKRSDAWRTVIQAPEHNYVQKVRLETCKNREASCFAPLVEFQDSYETFCEQKYNTWEVLVASKEPGGEPELIESSLPVCCSCRYKPVGLS